MPEPEKKGSEKERASAKKNEKEKDTLASPGPKGSPTPSQRGSAKKPAKTGSKPNSARAPSPPKSPKGKNASKGGKGKGKGKIEEKKEEAASPVAETEEEEGLPANVEPLFLTSKTQEIFECICDDQITKDQPFKLIPKADILDDLRMRAAVCDFAPFKQIMLDYPAEEILICYDSEFKYGQNFYMALTEEAKDKLLNPPSDSPDQQSRTPEDEVVYRYIPPEPKEWVDLGSERDIKEEMVTDKRKKITFSVRRKRREFGAPCLFEDRNVGDAKDGYVECTPFEDKMFDLRQSQLEKGTQAIPEFGESGCQTEWKYPRNASTQYFPREFEENEREKIDCSCELSNFVDGVTPRFELALQQNEIMDVFYNDWLHLGDADDTFGSKADNHLKEYQSFTDLIFSKDKCITCIQWHPTIKGVVAVSVAEKISFDDRIDQAQKIIMNPRLILIWSFTDPIHPQLLLESPDDIHSFQFCPSNANIIVGGCGNGQVVLWDISAHVDILKQPRGGNRNKKTNVLPGFEDPNALKTPIIRYCAVSSIEHSHKAAITDILWIPDHMEITRMGIPQENRSLHCCQVMTCATDHCVLLWDTRPLKAVQPPDDKGPKNPMGVANTFRHLDLTWRPMLKISLQKSEPGGDHSATKFTIQERQGDRSVLRKQSSSDIIERESSSGGFQFGNAKPGSGKDKKPLEGVNTFIYVGTEEGEVVYVDWMPQKDPDTGKIGTSKPEYYHSLHDGSIVCLQRSPFFKDVLLCVGGWTITLWKEGVTTGPLLHSAASNVRLTAGHWSPSRPAVFFITKMDGSVDVWDLLDKTHEPSLTQNVSPAPITTIFPFPVSNKQHLLAVGDNSGTLHVLEIPWSLRQPTPNELMGFTNYIDREVKRRAFVVARWDFRELEKRELENEAKKKAGIAPHVTLTEEEVEYKLKQEYHAYCEEESSFLRELGLKEDIEEPLPDV